MLEQKVEVAPETQRALSTGRLCEYCGESFEPAARRGRCCEELTLTGRYCMPYDVTVAPKERIITVRIESDLVDAMEGLREKTGASLSWQIRSALGPWLKAQGAAQKADRKRVGARKRP
jgi:hypothetical protein